MSFEFTYYRIFNTEDNAPRLGATTRPSYLYMGMKIENPNSVLMGFKFKKPVPRKPVMTDFLSTPRTVLSKKIYDVLRPLNIISIQFLPVEIQGKNGENYKGYWGLNVLKEIKCLDKKLSDLQDDGSGIYNVKKIVLDKEILEKIPLEERLVFCLEEHPYDLFHRSIVEKIMTVEPMGIKFVNFEDFTDTYYFEN